MRRIGHQHVFPWFRKRSTAITFYKEYFARLPGYPQLDGNGDLQLAVYSKIPGSGVLESEQLLSVIVGASADIEASLGMRL